jgi:flagellar biosynthesis activator protein FlaF
MQNAATAYARVANSVLSPREAEAAVLLKAATRLQSVQDNWSEGAGALNEALTFNQRVWTVIAGAATETDSPLPPALKQSVANLAAFVFTRTLDTMVQPHVESLSALIRINRELAAGLRGNG